MSLTKDDILSADDGKMREVDVPEWGGSVYVRSMSGRERDRYIQAAMDKQRSDDPRDVSVEGMEARLLVLTVCDENGTLLFDEDDVEALRDKNGRAIERLSSVARDLSGLSEEAMEDIAGN